MLSVPAGVRRLSRSWTVVLFCNARINRIHASGCIVYRYTRLVLYRHISLGLLRVCSRVFKENQLKAPSNKKLCATTQQKTLHWRIVDFLLVSSFLLLLLLLCFNCHFLIIRFSTSASTTVPSSSMWPFRVSSLLLTPQTKCLPQRELHYPGGT